MSNVWYFVLERFMNFISSEQFFTSVKEAVLIMVDSELTGVEKKELVFTEVKDLFKDESDSLINFAIEAAVLLFKNK